MISQATIAMFTEPVIEEKLRIAADRFLLTDSYLLGKEGSEWSLAHRYAVHLETQFNGWHVDCEHNRIADEKNNPKKISGGCVRPDIVVHQRGTEHNLIVIAAKTSRNKTAKTELEDKTALKQFKSEFAYQHVYFLTFNFSNKSVEFEVLTKEGEFVPLVV